MNLKELHGYLDGLLAAGVDPSMPVVALNNGWPNEISNAIGLEGEYHGDPSPKMSAFTLGKGKMLALVPIGEDESELLNPREDTRIVSHTEVEMPVESPYR